jgi:hypothetical protein
MVVDAFIDMDDDGGHLWMGAARCVNCGNVVDLGILKNQIRQHAGPVKGSRPAKVRPLRPRLSFPVRLSA